MCVMGNDFYSLARAANHLAAAFLHILTFNGKDTCDVVHRINKLYEVCRHVIEEDGNIMLADDVWEAIGVVDAIDAEVDCLSDDPCSSEHLALCCLSTTLNERKEDNE